MLDVRSGRIAYAVLGAGGFLGIGEKYFAIPWGALTLDTDNKCFILDADKERMNNAPGFDKDHWPSMADLTWAGHFMGITARARTGSESRADGIDVIIHADTVFTLPSGAVRVSCPLRPTVAP